MNCKMSFVSCKASFKEKAWRSRSTDNDPETLWDKFHYIIARESFLTIASIVRLRNFSSYV